MPGHQVFGDMNKVNQLHKAARATSSMASTLGSSAQQARAYSTIRIAPSPANLIRGSKRPQNECTSLLKHSFHVSRIAQGKKTCHRSLNGRSLPRNTPATCLATQMSFHLNQTDFKSPSAALLCAIICNHNEDNKSEPTVWNQVFYEH